LQDSFLKILRYNFWLIKSFTVVVVVPVGMWESRKTFPSYTQDLLLYHQNVLLLVFHNPTTDGAFGGYKILHIR